MVSRHTKKANSYDTMMKEDEEDEEDEEDDLWDRLLVRTRLTWRYLGIG